MWDISRQDLCTRSLAEVSWQDLCERSAHKVSKRDLQALSLSLRDLYTRFLFKLLKRSPYQVSEGDLLARSSWKVPVPNLCARSLEEVSRQDLFAGSPWQNRHCATTRAIRYAQTARTTKHESWKCVNDRLPSFTQVPATFFVEVSTVLREPRKMGLRHPKPCACHPKWSACAKIENGTETFAPVKTSSKFTKYCYCHEKRPLKPLLCIGLCRPTCTCHVDEKASRAGTCHAKRLTLPNLFRLLRNKYTARKTGTPRRRECTSATAVSMDTVSCETSFETWRPKNFCAVRWGLPKKVGHQGTNPRSNPGLTTTAGTPSVHTLLREQTI